MREREWHLKPKTGIHLWDFHKFLYVSMQFGDCRIGGLTQCIWISHQALYILPKKLNFELTFQQAELFLPLFTPLLYCLGFSSAICFIYTGAQKRRVMSKECLFGYTSQLCFQLEMNSNSTGATEIKPHSVRSCCSVFIIKTWFTK